MFYIKTLTIAGSDSSGGAGIQADLKTLSALGCYAASVITSVTAQNTLGVTAVQHISPEMVRAQLKAVMDDIKPDAIKIGMTGRAQTITAIADVLNDYPEAHIVIDPVMVSTSGSPLMEPDGIATLCQRLLPKATLLTPNLPEAEALAGIHIDSEAQIDLAARRIMDLGCKALLIKGGHLEGLQKTDRLYTADGQRFVFQSPTVPTRNTHGTGCTLSSAITAFLARGEALTDAIKLAKDYVTHALRAGNDVTLGDGYGPVNHFFNPEKLLKR
ncbi:bifunctional hydroxymethylpyrimidine kinase/phosphomethylpyrimidine kinase [Prevotella sp.]|uniref:bifunctional hydroxymethylpyrimidine kinase/phosphomethylpyrimidine kinase n=1 Tax=Prevotella sp. TaxID=59823 RepID=UPI002F95754B